MREPNDSSSDGLDPSTSEEPKPHFDPHEQTVSFREDETAPSPPKKLTVPPHLGRYEIQGLLGTGGFGQVFLAWDPQLGRKVAIKVPRNFASGIQYESFLREARRVAQLRHPSIVSVFDIGEFEGRCYIVSDYIPGVNLAQAIKEATYGWRQAVDLINQLTDALAHAHSMGIVHRDIKPSNIMITDAGWPVLLDFGLAVSDAEGRELPGTIAGTPEYMSPEQILGKAHRIDGRTDIYSLGVLLYRLLSGRMPFRANQLQDLLRQICEDEPQPLRQISPQLPKELDEICERALAKQASQRYRTAGDFASALKQVLTRHVSLDEGPRDHAHEDRVTQSLDTKALIQDPSTTKRIYDTERRQITGLFIRLDDELLTTGEFDPEEFREIVQEVHKVSSKIALQHSGYMAQSGAEGVLVYFGFPVSFEGVAQRALSAGLAMADAIQALMSRLQQTHPFVPVFALGVYSGTVVAEDKGTSDSFSRYSIIGNVAKLAASVAELAEPGTFAASYQVYRACSSEFEFQPLDRQLPGKATDSHRDVFVVLGERLLDESRQAYLLSAKTPLVGRDHELGMLTERWQLVLRGRGQIILIGAEPGVGKSRLIAEFRRTVAGKVVHLTAACSQYHQNTALRPMIEILEGQLNVAPLSDPSDRLGALEAFCGRSNLPRDEAVPLFADLLSIPMGGQYRIFEGTPEFRKRRTLEFCAEMVMHLCEEQPVVFLVEDLHWIDPTTEELLTLLLDQVSQWPCLLLLTYRTHYAMPWPMRPNLVQFLLTQLTEARTRELITHVAKGCRLPEPVVDRIVKKTDGVPLFVEEMTKAILESDSLELRGEEYTLRGNLDSLSTPMNLQDSIMARLDRLLVAKEVAQLGAILGREFSYELIRSVAPLEEPVLRKELTALVEAELLFQQGFFPRSRFTFKHALVQDVAYDSLLRKTRQEWHAKIAGVMESKFPQLLEAEPELLAHHFGEAGLSQRAAEYWLRAGIRAQNQSALAEALKALKTGLAHLEQMEPGPAHDQLEFRFQIPLGVCLLGRQGYASPEVGPVLERANQLASLHGGVFERFHILWGTWAWRVVREELQVCLELGEQAQKLIEHDSDPGLRMETLFIFGLTLFYRGDFTGSLAACQKGFDLYDAERCQLHSQHTGQNSGVTHQCYGALSLWHLGYPEQALAMGKNAVALARQIQHPFSLAYALHHLAWLYQHLRDPIEVFKCSDEALALATQQGFIFWMAESHLSRGYGYVLQNRFAEAEREIREGLQIFEQSGAALSMSHFYSMLAEIRFRLDDPAGALEWISEALKASARFGNTFHLAEIHRLHGEILSAESTPLAEESFQKSLNVARQQKALSPELRTAISLASLKQKQGSSTEAAGLLEAVLCRFQEGQQTPDFQAAQTLFLALR